MFLGRLFFPNQLTISDIKVSVEIRLIARPLTSMIDGTENIMSLRVATTPSKKLSGVGTTGGDEGL